jgi:PAS domain S-box-containing protein
LKSVFMSQGVHFRVGETPNDSQNVLNAKSRIVRHFLLAIGFVLLHQLLARPEIIFFSKLGFTSWYPAVGLSLAMMLGVSPWYALLSFASDVLNSTYVYHQPLISYSQTLGATGTAACYALAAWVSRGPLKIDFTLCRQRDVFRYILITSTAALGATLSGVTSLAADHTILWKEYGRAAAQWWLGDIIGLVGFAPFLLVHVLPRVRNCLNPHPALTSFLEDRRPILRKQAFLELAEAAGQVGILVASLWLMFGSRWDEMHPLYLGFIPVIWIAVRNGIRRIVVGLLALNFGVVVALHFSPPVPALLNKLGLFMLVISAIGLMVGSAMTERYRIDRELRDQSTYLNSLIENNPLGIVVLDRGGRIQLTNAALEKLFLYPAGELVGRSLAALFPDEKDNEPLRNLEEILGGRTIQKVVKRHCRDGAILDLELNAVPLLVNGRVGGAFGIYKDISESVRAAEGERQHAESLRQLVAELELRTQQMTLLKEMGDLLECCANTEEAFAVVGEYLHKLFSYAAAGVLYSFRASRNLVESSTCWGLGGLSESTFAPGQCWALRRGQPHWTEENAAIACQHVKRVAGTACLCIPMVGAGKYSWCSAPGIW